MLKKEITIAGKQVTLGYCFATEIAYQDMAGENIADYMTEAYAAIQADRVPNIKKTILAILACIVSFYNSTGEEAPVKDSELMNEATPEELGVAIGSVIELRTEFYKVPDAEENKPPKKEDDEKKE
jgi:hypothetical protein